MIMRINYFSNIILLKKQIILIFSDIYYILLELIFFLIHLFSLKSLNLAVFQIFSDNYQILVPVISNQVDRELRI
jgi:hypothetical protein